MLGRKAKHLARKRIEQDRETGRLLMELKGRTVHGGWEAWVEEHCGIKPRTAREYMKLAERWHEVLRLIDPNRRPAADLIRLSRKWILKQLAKSALGIGGGTSPGADSIGNGDAARGPGDEVVAAEADGREGHEPAKAHKADMSQGAATCHESSKPDDGRRLPSAVKKAAADGRAEQAKRAAKVSASSAGEPSLPGAEAVAVRDEGPDELWLQGLSIRSKLSGRNREKFDREATYWRRLKALDDRTRAADPGFLAEARDRLRKQLAEPLLADAFLFVRHPEDWRLCEDCRGSGVGRDGRPCCWCDGDGFLNLRHLDPFDEIEDSQAVLDEEFAEPCRRSEAGEAPHESEEPVGPRKGRRGKRSTAPPKSQPANTAETTAGPARRGKAGRDEQATAGARKTPKSRKQQAVDAKTQASRRPSRRRVAH